jgi:hypothetical protein
LESDFLLHVFRLLDVLPGWLGSEGLAGAIGRCVPEFASGLLTLRKVRPKRLHARAGERTVTFKLVVEDAAGRRTDVQLVGVFDAVPAAHSRSARAGLGLGDPEWTCAVPDLGLVLEAPPDAVLPAQAILTDALRARALLEAGIRAGSPRYADFRIERCTPEVKRSKPGSRCTVLYDLVLGPGAQGRGWPDRVVAKTRNGDGSRAAHERMRALWETQLSASDAVAIAEPLGLVEDSQVLIQRALPGDATFFDRLESALIRDMVTREDRDRLHGLLRTTARGLAGFHACGARVPRYGWQDEMAEVRGRVARLSEWVPGLDASLGDALDHLDGLAIAHPAERIVTSHGSFRPRQVMLNGERIAFIDTDGCCEAEPAMDLALFRTSMKTNITCSADGEERTADSPGWRGAVMEELDALGDRFLDEYERLAPVSRERVALWETLYLLENLLNTWEKIRPQQLASSEMLLERHFRRSLLG